MTSHHWWGRILRLAGVTIAFVVFALCALINIQQRLLRWRANQLLRDVRAIQMGHSTWEDAQRLMNRWGAWVNGLAPAPRQAAITRSLFRISRRLTRPTS